MFMFVGPRIRELMPNGHSVTEYVRHRFGTVPFISIAVVIIFVMGIFIAAEMTAITNAVHILTSTPKWITALGVGVVVVIYTAYGGLRASIFTDTIQFWVLMPALLLIVVVAAVLIGDSGAWSKAGDTGLLSFSSSGSYYFAIVLIIGIVASNAFHPGMWQRVYTVKDQQTLNRSLWTAAAISIPITFLMGLAGVAAVANGSVAPFQYPEVAAALFALGSDIFPIWMHFLMLICALLLAMSTLDTLMNGLASNVASDLADTHISTEGNALMWVARIVTVIVAIPSIFVASVFNSVLYVFLRGGLAGRGDSRSDADGAVLAAHARLGRGAGGRRGHSHRRALLSEAGPAVAVGADRAVRYADVLRVRVGAGGLVGDKRDSGAGSAVGAGL